MKDQRHGGRGEQDGAAPVFCIRRSLDEDGAGGRRRLQETIKRAKAGETDALHEIYKRYADNVFSYVRSIVRDEHAAEDVTQQVFAKLLTKIDRYEERSVPFAAWLLRIARNCAIDHLRSNRLVCADETLFADRPSAHEALATERRHVIRDALRSLSAAQREVIVLRHMVGLSPPEIATRIGKSEGAVHTLHHRARRAMRTELLARETAPACLGR